MSDLDVNAAAEAYALDVQSNKQIISQDLVHGAYGEDAYDVMTVSGSAIKPPTTTGDLLAITFFTTHGEVFSKFVTSQDAFRLPSGFKHDKLTVRLTGNVRIKSVRIAETMKGLANV